MTYLRQRMMEEMLVRNLSKCTQGSYVLQVSLFARHFKKSPELLGPEQIRAYQIYLLNEKKLAPVSIMVAISALRFLYGITLKKNWSLKDFIPVPKKPQTLPIVLSPERGSPSVPCMCPQPETPRDFDHVLRRGSAHLGGRCSHI